MAQGPAASIFGRCPGVMRASSWPSLVSLPPSPDSPGHHKWQIQEGIAAPLTRPPGKASDASDASTAATEPEKYSCHSKSSDCSSGSSQAFLRCRQHYASSSILLSAKVQFRVFSTAGSRTTTEFKASNASIVQAFPIQRSTETTW